LTLARICLLKGSLLKVTQDYFPNLSVRVIDGMEDVSSEELMGIQVMALEIIPKDRKVLIELLHRGEELRCVLFAGFQGAARWRPPQGWALDIMDIRHSEVGGVTDARTSFCVLRRGETCRGKGRRVLAMSKRPARDA
jgi:hypothetical protein